MTKRQFWAGNLGVCCENEIEDLDFQIELRLLECGYSAINVITNTILRLLKLVKLLKGSRGGLV